MKSLFLLLIMSLFYWWNTAQYLHGPMIEKGENTIKDSLILDEYFCDSLNIGRKTFDKIELSRYRLADSVFVVIKFYGRSKNSGWALKNKFSFEKDNLIDCLPEISDFNNDSLYDFTYISNRAARMANELRRLFIYDKANDQLISIVNSEDYPNMRYNKDLDCIDALLVSGSFCTEFLHIKNDSLVDFASVCADNHINVRLFDENGNEKYLIQDSVNNFGPFVRFKNYFPLAPYTCDDFKK